ELDDTDRLDRACNRGLRQFGGMRVARRFTCNSPQPKSLRRIVGSSLQPAVVECEALGLTGLEVQLAVVGAVQRLVEEPLDPASVHAGLGEKQVFVAGHWGRPGLGRPATSG